eukprot:jgi/Psemu1/32211/gm1.32211_g
MVLQNAATEHTNGKRKVTSTFLDYAGYVKRRKAESFYQIRKDMMEEDRVKANKLQHNEEDKYLLLAPNRAVGHILERIPGKLEKYGYAHAYELTQEQRDGELCYLSMWQISQNAFDLLARKSVHQTSLTIIKEYFSVRSNLKLAGCLTEELLYVGMATVFYSRLARIHASLVATPSADAMEVTVTKWMEETIAVVFAIARLHRMLHEWGNPITNDKIYNVLSKILTRLFSLSYKWGFKLGFIDQFSRNSLERLVDFLSKRWRDQRAKRTADDDLCATSEQNEAEQTGENNESMDGSATANQVSRATRSADDDLCSTPTTNEAEPTGESMDGSVAANQVSRATIPSDDDLCATPTRNEAEPTGEKKEIADGSTTANQVSRATRIADDDLCATPTTNEAEPTGEKKEIMSGSATANQVSQRKTASATLTEKRNDTDAKNAVARTMTVTNNNAPLFEFLNALDSDKLALRSRTHVQLELLDFTTMNSCQVVVSGGMDLKNLGQLLAFLTGFTQEYNWHSQKGKSLKDSSFALFFTGGISLPIGGKAKIKDMGKTGYKGILDKSVKVAQIFQGLTIGPDSSLFYDSETARDIHLDWWSGCHLRERPQKRLGITCVGIVANKCVRGRKPPLPRVVNDYVGMKENNKIGLNDRFIYETNDILRGNRDIPREPERNLVYGKSPEWILRRDANENAATPVLNHDDGSVVEPGREPSSIDIEMFSKELVATAGMPPCLWHYYS